MRTRSSKRTPVPVARDYSDIILAKGIRVSKKALKPTNGPKAARRKQTKGSGNGRAKGPVAVVEPVAAAAVAQAAAPVVPAAPQVVPAAIDVRAEDPFVDANDENDPIVYGVQIQPEMEVVDENVEEEEMEMELADPAAIVVAAEVAVHKDDSDAEGDEDTSSDSGAAEEEEEPAARDMTPSDAEGELADEEVFSESGAATDDGEENREPVPREELDQMMDGMNMDVDEDEAIHDEEVDGIEDAAADPAGAEDEEAIDDVDADDAQQMDDEEEEDEDQEDEEIEDPLNEEEEEEKKRMKEVEDKIITDLQKHREYKRLHNICSRLERLEAKANKDSANDLPRALPTHSFKKEVYEKGSQETPRIWDIRLQENAAEMDYIVASSSRVCGKMLITDKLLCKRKGIPIPSWTKTSKIDQKLINSFKLRQARCDSAEFFIRTVEGDFELDYPNRYAVEETGHGAGGYIADVKSLYKNRLRAIEADWNMTNSHDLEVDVLIEDWTNMSSMEEAEEAIKALEYITKSILDDETLKLRQKFLGSIAYMRCDEQCASHDNCSGGRVPGVGNCCALEVTIDSAGMPHFGEPNSEPIIVCRLECTDACGCDRARCQNRVVQAGRRHVILVFRHPRKGWTLRCLTQMDVEDLVGVYVGHVKVGLSETEEARAYDLNLHFEVKTGRGKETASLSVNAMKSGNATRYISHSCNANLRSEIVVVERNGMFDACSAFFPERVIIRGEEYSFDYFNGLGPKNARCDYRSFFEKCGCKSSLCRWLHM